MANKMLIDAAHPEETRVVVLRGNRVEEFDFESAHRRQLRGNIYLAKVTRVEPSLQAAFVEYGGNRHGFLAFSEIHPDYYQIPVADRQALIEEEERAHRAAEAEIERRAGRPRWQRGSAADRRSEVVQSELAAQPDAGPEDALLLDAQAEEAAAEEAAFAGEAATETSAFTELDHHETEDDRGREQPSFFREPESGAEAALAEESSEPDLAHEDVQDGSSPTTVEEPSEQNRASDKHTDPLSSATNEAAEGDGDAQGDNVQVTDDEEVVESVGGADALEEASDRPRRPRRQYKIQEVIKRRQVLLVQVVKEERGTKGAALTTYLSLAGRYCVLMPNTARGGGISRKITDARDRSRLKEVAQDLEVPEGMGVILRTAGASRTKIEIKRDFEYLLRVWETVRDLTLRSTAPTLVYEEGSLVKRSIRDLYTKDIDEIVVAGAQDCEEAREFMRMLMPSHVRNVKLYRDNQPLFSRHGIESQLDAMFSPVVQLRSGGYIVLNQTEALVSIDVNSGRATREHHIEDTALKTNLEAADEIARQLRLRDLAGLIVIDFIDMDEKRNDRSVERRLKDALKNDRARIQVGRISHFGLMEMSRQRIRASVLESSTDKCALCGGTGHVRSVSSVALQLLRLIEETLLKGGTHNLIVRTRTDIALYLLNHKRAHLRDLEQRFQIAITVNADAAMGGQQPFVIDKGEQVFTPEQARAIAQQPPVPLGEELEDAADDGPPEIAEAEEAADEAEEAGEVSDLEPPREDPRSESGEAGRGRRRRRRRGRRGSEGRPAEGFGPTPVADAPAMSAADEAEDAGEDAVDETEADAPAGLEADDGGAEGRRRRRRGRRGGRRNRRGLEGEAPYEPQSGPSPVEQPPHEAGDAFAHADDQVVPVEPELVSAVADFGGPPLSSQPHQPAAEAPAPETPRRRSTVREPVAVPTNGGSNASTATPTPAPPVDTVSHAPVPVSEHTDADKPRRTGWWAKRLLGDRG
jgi:ribonuclease E